MLRLAVIATAALAASSAFAAEGFDIPSWVASQGQVASTAGGYQVTGLGAPTCANKPAAIAYLKDWRQRARHGYAQMVAKYIPSLAPGATCIKAPDAIGVKYEPSGDFFTVTCLAQSRGRLTHLFKMELLVEPAECLSDTSINTFVNSSQCQSKGEIDRFVSLVMSPCPIAPTKPKLRSGNVAYPIDPAYFAHLLNTSPRIRNVVDEDRRVKVGRSEVTDTIGGDNQGTGSDCNAAACWPGAKTAK